MCYELLAVVLRLFIFNGLIAAGVLASDGNLSTAQCPNKLVEESSLNSTFDFSFDDRFPEYTDSLRSELPKIYRQLRQIMEATPSPARLFFEAACTGATYAELIEGVRAERNRIARELRKISNTIGKESQKALRSMDRESRRGRDPGNQRNLSEKALHWKAVILAFAEEFSLEQPLNESSAARRHEWNNYLKIRERLSNEVVINQRGDEHHLRWVHFDDWAYRIASLWGEIRVAAVVPHLKANNIRLWQFGESQLGIPRYPLGRIKKTELNTELDLLLQWEGKSTWGEVKTLRSPLQLETNTFTRVQLHAEHLIKLRNALCPTTEIHFFFVNGVSPEAKRDLEALGVGVY